MGASILEKNAFAFVLLGRAEHTQIYVFEDPAEATRMGGGDVATF